jgi:hypothetical protein
LLEKSKFPIVDYAIHSEINKIGGNFTFLPFFMESKT